MYCDNFFLYLFIYLLSFFFPFVSRLRGHINVSGEIQKRVSRDHVRFYFTLLELIDTKYSWKFLLISFSKIFFPGFEVNKFKDTRIFQTCIINPRNSENLSSTHYDNPNQSELEITFAKLNFIPPTSFEVSARSLKVTSISLPCTFTVQKLWKLFLAASNQVR